MISMLSDFLKFRHQLIFSLDLPDLRNVVPMIGVTFTEITKDNIDHVLDIRDASHLKYFHQFLDEGQFGIYAWSGSKVIGHGWAKLCGKKHCRVNGYIDILHGEALIHYCYVSHIYRGKNIYPSMIAALCKMLFFKRHVKRVLIDAEVDNISSCRGISKVGFKFYGKCRYIQCRGRLICEIGNLK